MQYEQTHCKQTVPDPGTRQRHPMRFKQDRIPPDHDSKSIDQGRYSCRQDPPTTNGESLKDFTRANKVDRMLSQASDPISGDKRT